MATEKRARQKANRARKLEQEQKSERKQQTRQYVLIGLLVAVGLAGVLFLLSRGGDDESAATTSLTLNTTSTTEAEPEAEPGVVAPDAGGAIEGTAECPAADGSSERITSFSEAPPTCIDPTATYTAEIDTTLGTVSLELDAAAAPETVNNFVFLSRYHYYDGAPFHRIIPGFVIQGGDAVGNPLGTGNPGYAISDELPADGAYTVGSIAMANSGPDTSGSQFFIVTGPQGESLPPQYSLFGTVTAGLDTVTAIEELPTTSGNFPTEEIYINSITITES